MRGLTSHCGPGVCSKGLKYRNPRTVNERSDQKRYPQSSSTQRDRPPSRPIGHDSPVTFVQALRFLECFSSPPERKHPLGCSRCRRKLQRSGQPFQKFVLREGLGNQRVMPEAAWKLVAAVSCHYDKRKCRFFQSFH